MAVSTNVNDRLETFKCLSCLSESDLLKVMLVVLADASTSGYTLPGDTAQLLEDSACWACLSDKQLLQAQVSALAEDIETGTTLEEFRNKIKCLLCAQPKQIRAAVAYLTTIVATSTR